jgi:hypothetical protein
MDNSTSKNTAGNTTGVRLLVKTGVHAGTEVDIADGQEIFIGGSEEDEICLLDPAIEPGHLAVAVVDKQMHIRCSRATYAGMDSEPLAPDKTWSINVDELKDLPLRLRIGDTELLFGGPDVSATSAEPLLSTPPASQSNRPAVFTRLLLWPRLYPQRVAAVCIVSFLSVLVGHRLLTNAGVHSTPERQKKAETDLLSVERQIQSNASWQKIKVKLNPEGRIELVGSIQSRESLNKLIKDSNLDLVEPKVRVVVAQELVGHIKDFIQDDSVEISFEDRGATNTPLIVLSGQTSKSQLRQTLKLLTVELRDRVEIEDRTIYAPKESERRKLLVELPIRVAAVNSVEKYVESTAGAKYFEGSAISKDCVVDSVLEDVVVFSVNGKRVDFPVN